MIMSMDLTKFLLARIDEREAELREAQRLGYSSTLAYAQLLAECEAARRIVALHQLMDYPHPYRGTPCCERCTAGGEYPADDASSDAQNWPCPTLRALALPYAEHPDYLDEWKP